MQSWLELDVLESLNLQVKSQTGLTYGAVLSKPPMIKKRNEFNGGFILNPAALKKASKKRVYLNQHEQNKKAAQFIVEFRSEMVSCEGLRPKSLDIASILIVSIYR